MTRRHRIRRPLTFFGAVSLASGILLGPLVVPASAIEVCGSSNGVSICVSVPDGQLSGDVPIAVTVNGSTSDIKEMIFQWGPSTSSTTQLLTDYEYPYGFTWRTDQYLDATQFLNVRVKRLDDSVGGPVPLQLTLENGNDTSVPQNPNDWEQLFEPRPFNGDPVIAAVGDGGDGTVRADEVAASILGSQAAIVVYLGDLYERGTPAELDENFGRSAFEPEGGDAWGALSRFTRPTLGNHEAFNLAAWRNYWHGRPDWETLVFGGVRFLNLNSECALVGGCGPSSAQYAFVQSVLASNTHECVVAFWHRPVLSSVDDSADMQPIWALLADGGGDLVLNGHTHDMEAYAPLSASLEAGGPDAHMVELVSGAGGHYLTSAVNTDPRGVWQATKVAGAAYITAVGGGTGAATGLNWAFRDRSGEIVSGTGGQGTGSVECADEPDTTTEVFSDDFSTGNFSRWSGVTNLTIDTTRGGIAPPSARGQASGTRAWAFRTLGSTHANLCQAMRVNLASIGTNSVDMLRLRTGSDGPVARVYVNSARTLWIRSDVSGQQLSSSRQLPAGWNTLELCATVDSSGSLRLALNGAVIAGPWTVNLGTTPIGRIQIGDTALRTWSANFDDVRVTSGGPTADTVAPSVPGRPSGVSDSAGTIDLTWAASTDDRASTLIYAVHRDGGSTPVGTVTSSSTTTVSFQDSGLAAGNTHTYEVTASDGTNTSARSPASAPITVSGTAAVFSDDFSTGNFSRWSGVTNLTIDTTRGGIAPPSARGQASGTRAWAFRTLGSTHVNLCQAMRVNLASIGTNSVDMLRLRTGSDGPVARVYVNSARTLWIRSDVSGQQLSSSRQLPTGWNTLELCATVGSSGSLSLALNGAVIAGPWTVNMGTTPIGRIQIGDTALRTWSANFDDVFVTS